MLRIPAVLLYHDIRRGEEGVDQRHVGSHHQNTGCQASSPLHSNNERNPIVWVCWIYHNLSLCQSQETKESFVHFVMKRAGDSELCITPEARGRHVADTCPAQCILFIQYWWPDFYLVFEDWKTVGELEQALRRFLWAAQIYILKQISRLLNCFQMDLKLSNLQGTNSQS